MERRGGSQPFRAPKCAFSGEITRAQCSGRRVTIRLPPHQVGLAAVEVVGALECRNPAAGYGDFAGHPATEAGGEEREGIGGALAACGEERSTYVGLAAPIYKVADGLGGDAAIQAAHLTHHGIGEGKLRGGRETLDPFPTIQNRRSGEFYEDRLGKMRVTKHQLTLGQSRQLDLGGR